MPSGRSSERKVACNPCRQRKTACDGTHPSCGLCVRNGFTCEYADRQRTPGLRAGYVAQLEKRIAQLEERLLHVETRLNGQTPQIPDVDGPPGQIAEFSANNEYPLTINTDDLDDESLREAQPLPPGALEFMDGRSDEAWDLSRSMISDLCSIWFEKYHRWFPILHQPTFNQIMNQSDITMPSNQKIVIEAIAVATMEHSETLSADPVRRQQWQDDLAASVLTRAIATASLESVQALLILSALSYGHGKLMEAWNMLSICRRIASHMSNDIMTDQSAPTATTPTALRRLPTHTNLVVADEEKIRAFWMTRMLENISLIGARYEAGSTTVPGDPLLPCSDSFWTSPDMVMGEGQIRPFGYCSAFSLSIILAVSELSYVHQFLRKPVDMTTFAERDAWQSEAQQIDERLTAWRDEFVAAFFRLANAEYAHHERAEMDAYVVLTNCVLNTAVITLLHRRSPCPPGIDQVVEPWAFASNRCVYASENTAFKIRQMHEDELVNCHPHLPFSIFVAARFYIVHSKALDANVPTNLHSLAFALHTCGQRWALARLFEGIIRIAVAEYRTPIAASTVPRGFYDLRLTTFEIAEALIEWARGPGARAAADLGSMRADRTATFLPMAVDALA